MKSFLRLLPLLVAAVFAAPLPALQAADAPTAKTYKVNLSPAFKVGQKFTVVTDSTQSDVANIALTPAGAAPQVQNQKQQVAAHLEAEAEVLAIFPHGGSQKLALTVKVLTATANGQPVPNLPGAGAKITAERVGKDKNFTVDGKPADATQAKFLGMVINPDNEKHID